MERTVRPSNWRDFVAEHGWGTALERIHSRTRKVGDCVLWTGKLRNDVGQIRVWINGYVWTDSILRVVWMAQFGRAIPEGNSIKRTCRSNRCIKHLVCVRNGTYASTEERHAWEQMMFHAGKRLTKVQVATIRSWYRAGKNMSILAQRFGVGQMVISRAARGITYARQPGAVIRRTEQ